MEKISVIAPIALTETFDEVTQAWRQNVNLDARLRAQLMFKTFFRRFDQSAVENFAVVCPDRDHEQVVELIEEVAAARVTVSKESAFFERCGLNSAALSNCGGWTIQQLVKLGFANVCPSDFYLTLDSDIVQFRAAGLRDLFPDGERALVGVETRADYDRLYTEESAREEEIGKKSYYERSAAILGHSRPEDRRGIFFSETPVLLHAASVLEMRAHIEAMHGNSICDVLSYYRGWTEYSLYFQFLEMTGRLAELCVSGDANSVLSLDKSVWHPRQWYKAERFYDRAHFSASSFVREGPFLAVQSFLFPQDWLPTRFHATAEFFAQLESWLDPSSPSQSEAEAADPAHPLAFLRILEKTDPNSMLARRSRQVLDEAIEKAPPVPAATPRGEPKFLTIGMTTFNDYDGCYFTIQAIRLYHPEILDDIELLVVDNDPAGPCAKSLKALENWTPNYRYVPHRSRKSTAVRDLIFREASGEFALCIDCHIFFAPGALARLIEYCREHPDTKDLLQGPLLSDALEPLGTQFDPVWSHGMYGVWGMDERGADADGPPFDIGMQGLGAFACRRQAWPGLNPRLAGFGGEEGYLHEKIRRAGGRTLCLPFLRWMHRFERPTGIPYKPDWGDRVRNYLLIHDELGLDPAPVIQHFEEHVGKGATSDMVREAQQEIGGPFHFFDAIYCINLDRQTDRWDKMRQRFHQLGIWRGLRRMSAAETPGNYHIGCALSHRRIIEEAKREQLETVLVFEDDAIFSVDAADVLRQGLRELQGRNWQLLYLGGYRDANRLQPIPGCENLIVPGWICCTHAIAYHHSVYDAILDSTPDNAVDMALWARTHTAIDQFYNRDLQAERLLVWPVIATQPYLLSEEGDRRFDV